MIVDAILRKLHWYNELEIDELDTAKYDPLPDEMIVNLENTLGVILPGDYKIMLQNHHGDSPLESDIRDQETAEVMIGGMGNLLNADPADSNSVYSCAEYVADRVIPFAEDGGGNFTCFDYRNGIHSPQIVFWFHEYDEDENYSLLASSFSEFIERLEIPEDVIEDLLEQGLLPEDLR